MIVTPATITGGKRKRPNTGAESQNCWNDIGGVGQTSTRQAGKQCLQAHWFKPSPTCLTRPAGYAWPADFKEGVDVCQVDFFRCGLCADVVRSPVCIHNETETQHACGHLFCGHCLYQHCSQSLDNLVLCPAAKCGRPIDHVLPDLTAEHYLSGLVLGTVQETVNTKHQHWPPEVRVKAMELFETKGWKAVEEEFPTLHHSTFDYWKGHAYMQETDRNKQGQGRRSFFDDDEEEAIRIKLFAHPVPTRHVLIKLMLDHARDKERQLNEAGVKIKHPLKAQPKYVRNFAIRRDIAFRKPHPVSAARFSRVAGSRKGELAYEEGFGELGGAREPNTKKPHLPLQELDMIYSVADTRAKRMLMENNGLPSDVNVVLNDECRLKPSLLWGEGRVQVCVDIRVKGAKSQRAFVPLEVSSSFSGITCLSSVTMVGRKLTLMLVTDTKYAANVEIPSRDWLAKKLNLTAAQVESLPDPLLVVAQSASTFNNSHLHSGVYAPTVFGNHPDLAAWQKRVHLPTPTPNIPRLLYPGRAPPVLY
jgi:hypothetical protein